MEGEGASAVRHRTLTQRDFDRFAMLSGDDNPIHVDPGYAAGSRFGRPVAHGMLLYSLVCGLLGEAFPGAAQVSQTLMFPAPTFAGEDVTVEARVVGGTGSRAEVSVEIRTRTGEVTCTGTAVLEGVR
jgi:acyl dehydratase